MKKISVLSAKIIIILIAIMVLILPKVIGTTTVISDDSNVVKYTDDLGKLCYGTVKDSEFEKAISEIYPDVTFVYTDTIEDAALLVKEKKADAVIVLEEQIHTLSENYGLGIFPVAIGSPGYFEKEYYVLLDPDLVGFNVTSKTKEEINKEPFEATFLTGVNISDFIPTSPVNNISLISFDTFIDSFTAADSGKYVTTLHFSDQFDVVQESYPNLATIPGVAIKQPESFAFPKTEEGLALRNQFNEFVREYKESGEFNKLVDYWTTGNDYEIPEYTFTGENGTLSIACLASWEPMYFYMGNTLTGRLIVLLEEFCVRYGYTPDFEVLTSFASEIAGLKSGQYDIVCDCIAICDAAEKEMYLADQIYAGHLYLATQKDDVPVNNGNKTVSKASLWLKEIYEGFKINILDENRYILILEGLKVTLNLAVLAGIFGTILGAIVCFLKMNNNPFAIAISSLYIKLIQGIPLVLLLLLLYYVVFTNSNISAFWVCVIGFSLDFAAYVSEIFRTNILAVPSGQKKAALALGFTPLQSFFRVIFPQALLSIIPVYSGQFIAMVKMTSIAGYIAVMDLTKIADIIRARTYQAFFPLIITAVLYFAISNLLVLGLRLLERKLDPTKRKRSVKGVVEK